MRRYNNIDNLVSPWVCSIHYVQILTGRKYRCFDSELPIYRRCVRANFIKKELGSKQQAMTIQQGYHVIGVYSPSALFCFSLSAWVRFAIVSLISHQTTVVVYTWNMRRQLWFWPLILLNNLDKVSWPPRLTILHPFLTENSAGSHKWWHWCSPYKADKAYKSAGEESFQLTTG